MQLRLRQGRAGGLQRLVAEPAQLLPDGANSAFVTETRQIRSPISDRSTSSTEGRSIRPNPFLRPGRHLFTSSSTSITEQK